MSDFLFRATALADSERSRRNSRLRLVHRQRSNSHLNSLKEGSLAPRIRMSIVNQPITDFSSPSATHISLGPQAEIGDIDFEIQPSLIRMVQGSTFSGKPDEDAKTHLKALVWFWIIDETLVLTSLLSVCRLNEVGTCQVMEQVMIMVMMVMTTR